MIPFSSAAPLNPAQIVAATCAMLAISRVDRATRTRLALIRGFYEDFCPMWRCPVSAFDRQPGHREQTGRACSRIDQRDLVLASCLMVAYADGALSSAERGAVLALSQQMGIASAEFDKVLRLVQDYLLQQVSGLPDAASVAKVAQELQ